MRRINYLFLALFATLAFAACSDDDDDKKDPEMAFCTIDQDPTEDKCKPFCDNPVNSEHEKCKKDDGFTTPDPATNLCVGQEDEYAAIESNIVDIATTAALGCGAVSADTTDPAEVEELNACVALGIADADDVEITAECAYCTARVVACAAANCLSVCASTDTPEKARACEDCRAENECEEGMVECQGFDTEEEVDCTENENLGNPACETERAAFCAEEDDGDLVNLEEGVCETERAAFCAEEDDGDLVNLDEVVCETERAAFCAEEDDGDPVNLEDALCEDELTAFCEDAENEEHALCAT